MSSTSCDRCPIGFSQSDQGQASCIQCSPGEFNNIIGAKECKDCAINTYYGDKGRNSTCIECPTGWSTDETGSAKCQQCGAGTYGDGCKTCPKGYARNGTDPDATQCRQCERGQTTSDTGAIKCEYCDAGSFGSQNTICSKCPTGFYQDTRGKRECKECTIGHSFTLTSCRRCDLGKHGSSNGECVDCPAGQYQDSTGEKVCKACEVNSYLNETGKSSKADCTKCKTQRSTGHSTGNSDVSACLCKKINYYQTEQNECEACPTGADCSSHDGMRLSELFAKPGYYMHRSDPKRSTFISCHQGYTPPSQVLQTEERCCPLNSITKISICSTVNASSIGTHCLTG